MTQPLAPGWYPDPEDPSRNLYWDGRTWHRKGAPFLAQPSFAPPPAPKNRHRLLWLILTLVVFAWVANQCSSPSKNSSSRNKSSSASASPTSRAPDPWKWMPGNGTYEMGGADGKNWGVWVSDGTTGVKPGKPCTWSIVSVARYRGGEVLDQGEAPAGQKATADIEPDGDVHSFDGTIGEDHHRLVFMTSNCGAWKPQ